MVVRRLAKRHPACSGVEEWTSPRHIQLNRPAIELLKSVPQTEGNPYVFPAPTTGRPMPHLFFPWDRIRKRAGLIDLRLHDLRHSFASFLVNKRKGLYVVQMLLGHKNYRTTSGTLIFQEKRLWM